MIDLKGVVIVAIMIMIINRPGLVGQWEVLVNAATWKHDLLR